MFKTGSTSVSNSEQFKALIEASYDAVYSMNADWSELFELKGKRFMEDSLHPDRAWIDKYVFKEDQDHLKEQIKHAIQTKSPFEMEHRVHKIDGTVGWVHSRAIPVLNSDNAIVEWFGVASDITERKKIELSLKEAKDTFESQKRLYETITSNTPDLIYVFDKEYRFTYANQALLTMWGKSWDEAIGKGLLENGYEPWHAEMHHREIDEVIKTKQPIRGFVSFPHAIQGSRIYDYIFVPVLDNQGEVEAIAGTTRDITELKKAIDESRESEAQLQQKVKERTEALERSNDELQQFAHVASHDMKEPLRKIGLFSTILKDKFSTDIPAPAFSYIEKIERSAARLYSLITNVLQYSSISGDTIPFAPVDLNNLVASIETDLEIIIKEKNSKIRYDNLPVLLGSPTLLHQLFYNLIQNSIKFSKADRPLVVTVTAELAASEDIPDSASRSGNDYVKIRVVDNGIGFDQKYVDTIFQSFSRLNSRDEYEGTGLGLALCKKIVERHQGTIRANGMVDVGAEFTMVLPTAITE